MDGIANVARQQQSQMNVAENSEKVAQTQKVDVVKEMQKEGTEIKKINSEQDVQDLVDKLNKALNPFNTSIKFGVDSQDVFYVSVIESQTQKMLRRYPAEEAAGFLPKMQEVTGILFDSKG